ncbi:MAG: peptidylprolyl isomerase [Pyrinomonadaceae bacterium]
MKKLILIAAVALILNSFATAQVPVTTGIQILKAEDARRYDAALEGLMRSPNSAVRIRAALAAGRIGDEKAITALAALLENDTNDDVRAMAAFALGEIESVKAAVLIIKAIKSDTRPGTPGGVPTLSLKPANVTARLIEAAGKIAAANAKDESAKALGKVILEELEREDTTTFGQDRTTVLLGLTAVLRVRPEGGEVTAAKFLLSKDSRIRTDAGNTMARLRAKNASANLRGMLDSDNEPAARANAARALGAAEDKTAYELLLKAATNDTDSRVRISAIRSLGSLKDARAADKLIERGNYLLIPIHGDPGPIKPGQNTGNLKPIEVPIPKSELLEIATVVGRLLANTENDKAIEFLTKLRIADKYQSSETEIAFARIAPKAYLASKPPLDVLYSDFHAASAYGQGLADIATLKNEAMNAQAGEILTKFIAEMATGVRPADQARMLKAMPDLTGAMAALKPGNLEEILRGQLANNDVFIRAAAAGALADLPSTKESVSALNDAFSKATVTDKFENDAQLAILDALVKLDKKAGVGSYSIALASPDYLVRKKAFEILADKDLESAYPGMTATVASERKNHKDQVLPYKPVFGTKLGQVLNSDLDYRRASSRKNGSVKAVLTTEKGSFTIVFYPEDAPLTVDNWVKLARSGYFNGLEVHRVVPNFVMQDGDPRGDGNGGPGWSIRCEVNMREYDRGAVGMALSGKDTGGSQWFVTHSPQPHLDGGYTVFGHVSEADMTVVDRIVRGDRILKVTIIGK